MKRKAILFTLLLLLLFAHGVQAMSSANFTLDWFTPLTSNGGGTSSSANYATNFTVGQSVIGASSSPNYGSGLGYWYGTALIFRVRLPLITKP
jgi:hypothetical protein